MSARLVVWSLIALAWAYYTYALVHYATPEQRHVLGRFLVGAVDILAEALR